MLQNISPERNFTWNIYFITNTSKENYVVQMKPHYLNIIYNDHIKMIKFAIFNKKKTRRQLTELKLKRMDYFAIWKENLKNHRCSFLFNRNHNIASFLTFHLDNHPHIRTINVFKNNFWCSVERLSRITSDDPDVIFKESGRSDRSKAARRTFVSISAKSKALVQSGLLDCHKEIAQRESEMEEKTRPSSKNGGTSRDICRAYCHALGLVANKCGAERVGDEEWKRQSRGDTMSPFWRPCWLRKKRDRKSKKERERKIEPSYCDEDSYSNLR